MQHTKPIARQVFSHENLLRARFSHTKIYCAPALLAYICSHSLTHTSIVTVSNLTISSSVPIKTQGRGCINMGTVGSSHVLYESTLVKIWRTSKLRQILEWMEFIQHQ